MALTRTQRKNLAKLADYLESLPRRYRHFEMRDFTGLPEGDERLIEYARHNGGVGKCGTVACAVGHGPAAGILFRRQDFHRMPHGRLRANWTRYSQRFAPRGLDEPEFDWAFGSPWSKVDNHHWGAAARIRYLLKHGAPPDGFDWFTNEGEFVEAYRPFDKRHTAKHPA